MNNNGFVPGVLIGIVIGIFLGLTTGVASICKLSLEWRREAVEKGHAEYVLQGDEAVWQWKEPVTK